MTYESAISHVLPPLPAASDVDAAAVKFSSTRAWWVSIGLTLTGFHRCATEELPQIEGLPVTTSILTSRASQVRDLVYDSLALERPVGKLRS